MDVSTYIALRGDTDAAQELTHRGMLPYWVSDALGLEQEPRTVRELYEWDNILDHLPQWVQSCKYDYWAHGLANLVRDYIRAAVEYAAEACHIRYEVDVRVYLGGNLCRSDSFEADDCEEAAEHVRRFHVGE